MAGCVRKSDDSWGSAIRIAYRISLRSSSLWEPRYPSLKIFLVFYYLFILGLENRFKRCDARINKFILTNTNRTVFRFWICVNDPSAGSPTETLLRLLLPLSDKIYLNSLGLKGATNVQKVHRTTRSVGATGGVYKGQGRIQHTLVTYAYKEFLVHDPKLQRSIPSTTSIIKISLHLSGKEACCTSQCSTRAAQDI